MRICVFANGNERMIKCAGDYRGFSSFSLRRIVCRRKSGIIPIDGRETLLQETLFTRDVWDLEKKLVNVVYSGTRDGVLYHSSKYFSSKAEKISDKIYVYSLRVYFCNK